MTATGQPAAAVPVKRHHWIVRLTHWLTFVLLAGMIMSGLQIYAAYARFGERGGPYYAPNPFQDRAVSRTFRLGGWLAGGLNWHFTLMWPLVIRGAVEMQKYYLRLRKDHPPQGKHNPLQKFAYTFIILLGVLSVLTGFAIYKPTQLSWLTALFGGFQAARYWHFWAVWIFTAFLIVHVILVFVVDPASLRAMITGWYRGRFPSHD